MSKTCRSSFGQQIQRLHKQLKADRTGGKNLLPSKICYYVSKCGVKVQQLPLLTKARYSVTAGKMCK